MNAKMMASGGAAMKSKMKAGGGMMKKKGYAAGGMASKKTETSMQSGMGESVSVRGVGAARAQKATIY